METMINKKMESGIFNALIYCVFFIVLGYGSHRFYEKKVTKIEVFEYEGERKVKLENEELSFVYLIDSFDQVEGIILNLGKLFKLVSSLGGKMYFIIKQCEAKKLEALFNMHDINEKIYLTNRLIFWKYSEGNDPTLLIFKNNKLVHSVYGCKNWNIKNTTKEIYLKLKGN